MREIYAGLKSKLQECNKEDKSLQNLFILTVAGQPLPLPSSESGTCCVTRDEGLKSRYCSSIDCDLVEELMFNTEMVRDEMSVTVHQRMSVR